MRMTGKMTENANFKFSFISKKKYTE
jgi:hypothetical protein